ncbi:MAG: hypothetical protein PHQ75_10810, partial [Thermoguttaceae bacterium]|nr:hypothetical protein [Thermoguttaceae bacterium]
MQLHFKTCAVVSSFFLTFLWTLACPGAETRPDTSVWPANGMNHRVMIQVDENSFASGGLFELPVDLKKLAQAQGQSGKKTLTLSENNLALAVCVRGAIQPLPFRYRIPNDAMGESVLRFVLPPRSVSLYL